MLIRDGIFLEIMKIIFFFAVSLFPKKCIKFFIYEVYYFFFDKWSLLFLYRQVTLI